MWYKNITPKSHRSVNNEELFFFSYLIHCQIQAMVSFLVLTNEGHANFTLQCYVMVCYVVIYIYTLDVNTTLLLVLFER